MAQCCVDFLNQAEIEFMLKDQLYNAIQKETRIPVLIAQLNAMGLEKDLFGALTELITAKLSY